MRAGSAMEIRSHFSTSSPPPEAHRQPSRFNLSRGKGRWRNLAFKTHWCAVVVIVVVAGKAGLPYVFTLVAGCVTSACLAAVLVASSVRLCERFNAF